MRSNDHALSALLPAVNKVVEGDEEDEMVSIALEQAFELVSTSAEDVGWELMCLLLR